MSVWTAVLVRLPLTRRWYRFISCKASFQCTGLWLSKLSKANAAGTVDAIVSALETECECSDWKSKLVGLSADGAVANMGVRSGLQSKYKTNFPI